MEDDTKKLIILGLITGLGCFGFKYMMKLLHDQNERKKTIIQQGSPYTPLSLLKKANNISEKGEFMMVSGICLREDIDDKAQIEQIISRVRTDQKLYKIIYKQDLEGSSFRSPTYQKSIPLVNQFLLLDPSGQGKQSMIVAPGSIAWGTNLKHKRTSKADYSYLNKRTEFYEKLSLIAYEGSSLTLLGLVKYDTA